MASVLFRHTRRLSQTTRDRPQVRRAKTSGNEIFLPTSPGRWVLSGLQHPGGRAEAAEALCKPPGCAVLELATRGHRDAERESREHARNAMVAVLGGAPLGAEQEGLGTLVAPVAIRNDSHNHSLIVALRSPNTTPSPYPQVTPHHGTLHNSEPSPIAAHLGSPPVTGLSLHHPLAPLHMTPHQGISPSLPTPPATHCFPSQLFPPPSTPPRPHHHCAQKETGCMDGANPKGLFKNY